MKKLTVAIIGGGNRAQVYGDIMRKIPDKYQITALAEPIDNRREFLMRRHKISPDMCFRTWEELLEKGKVADLCMITTMDRLRIGPAMKAIKLGYHLMLEKPIASTLEECKMITRAAEEKGVKVIICTVLRYTGLFIKLKEIIDSGRIGKVMSINHEEGVGDVHQTHSYVRGNWGNSAKSADMLVQKSCHDIDIIQWLIDKKCKSVQSYGMLSYFKRDNAPEGSPDYCIDGCPVGDECPYNAVKLYLPDDSYWMRSTCSRVFEVTDADVEKAIRETQYGKCVFKCDNDVVDHQTVNMLFEDDITVTFTMNAFNKGGRHMHIMGTKGEIRISTVGDEVIHLYDFVTKQHEDIPFNDLGCITGAHGGGDDGLVQAIYEELNDAYKGKSVPTIRQSYYNHVITFAIEEARKKGIIIDFENYYANVEKN